MVGNGEILSLIADVLQAMRNPSLSAAQVVHMAWYAWLHLDRAAVCQDVKVTRSKTKNTTCRMKNKSKRDMIGGVSSQFLCKGSVALKCIWACSRKGLGRTRIWVTRRGWHLTYDLVESSLGVELYKMAAPWHRFLCKQVSGSRCSLATQMPRWNTVPRCFD